MMEPRSSLRRGSGGTVWSICSSACIATVELLMLDMMLGVQLELEGEPFMTAGRGLAHRRGRASFEESCQDPGKVEGSRYPGRSCYLHQHRDC